jgi:hypothetical protein
MSTSQAHQDLAYLASRHAFLLACWASIQECLTFGLHDSMPDIHLRQLL